MSEQIMRVCPVCEQSYTEFPALSRKDNKTEICPECGIKEAVENWNKVASKNGRIPIVTVEDFAKAMEILEEVLSK